MAYLGGVLCSACGSAPAESGFSDAGGADTAAPVDAGDASTVDDAGAPTTQNEGDGFLGSLEGRVPSGCSVCSTDLHQLLDCSTHQVLQTCSADTGCGSGGQCMAPCDAATSNHSSVGCEYYVINPDAFTNIPDSPIGNASLAGSCFAMFLANTWTTAARVTLEFDGQALDVSKSLYSTQGTGAGLTYAPISTGAIEPNQVAILFLSQTTAPGDGSTSSGANKAVACPSGVTASYALDPAVHGTGTGHAFHVSSSVPIVAYDIYPYGGAISQISSATLLLPTSVWDVNYVATTGYIGETNGSLHLNGNLVFVASQDHTSVTMRSVADVVGGTGVAPATRGSPQTYVIDHGEVLQFEQSDDLSGSAVLADKPIGVWGGHYAMYIPDSSVPYADAAHQQIPPVKALGNEYVAVRYRSRTATQESVPWRLVGAVDGTILRYEPAAPAGAPATLSQGQVVEFSAPGPFVVASQDAMHPFYAAAHMTGGSLTGGGSLGSTGLALGDPETVNIVPPSQFLDHYVFFTDPTYAETNLVVVRDKNAGRDVSLDCATAPLGGWQPIGVRYEYTRVDVQMGGAKVGGCDNGRHEMTSAAPFGVTVWGFDRSVSYAYPAGASVKPVNMVVVPVMLH